MRTPPTDATDGRDRILVVGTPYVGDTVLAVPVLRNLRAAFPHHAIDFLAEGPVAERLLAGCPHVDEVLRWDRPPRRPGPDQTSGRRPAFPSFVSIAACGAALQARTYARAYLLKRSLSAALVALAAGIPHRVGHAAGPARLLLTRPVPRRRATHFADVLLDLLRADGLPVDDGRVEHWGPTAESLARVATHLARLPAGRPRVFVSLKATAWQRQWPLARWIDAIRRLVREHGVEIVCCGCPREAAAIAAVVAELGPVGARVHDLSTAVPLADVPALLARMDVYVGVNSGLMHLAAACGTPTVAIFDPADTARWSPRGAAHAILCGTPPSRGVVDWFHRPRRGSVDGVHAAGPALGAVTVDAVVAATVAAVEPRPRRAAFRTLDLRTGGRRYEVLAGPTPAAAVPATKPLAHAH